PGGARGGGGGRERARSAGRAAGHAGGADPTGAATAVNWLAITLWGGAVGMDATSFPQVMVSRPIVAAPVTGLLLGRPLEGVAVGALLELFALVILPIGAARYPESGTAAVAATAGYVAASGGVQRADLL